MHIVTGGAGFIGSAVIRHLIRNTGHDVVNLDCLTYAASLEALEDIPDSPRYRFERVDIGYAPAVREVFARHSPDAVMHLAAESHVDRSIDSPRDFVTTNVVGTCVLLEAALEHYEALSAPARERFACLTEHARADRDPSVPPRHEGFMACGHEGGAMRIGHAATSAFVSTPSSVSAVLTMPGPRAKSVARGVRANPG